MPWLRRALVIATLIALPGGAVSVYLSLGSPNLAGQAIAGPLKDPHQGQSVPELVGRVEAYLARNPEDGRAWEVLAPVYLRLGRFDDAVVARRKALAYNGETAERQADLGEAIAAAAKWTVTAEAKAAFERARVLDSSEIKTRYFFGLAAEQEGRPQDAAAIWRAMLAEAPAQANWIGTVRTALGRVDGTASKSTSAPSTATPAPSSAADTAAASGASSSASPHGDAASANDAASGHASSAASATDPAQHDDKIRGMVSRLADRLKSKGGELDEWVQLVRSYLVLGDKDKAREAANDGESAMASDPEKLGRLRTVLKELGLER